MTIEDYLKKYATTVKQTGKGVYVFTLVNNKCVTVKHCPHTAKVLDIYIKYEYSATDNGNICESCNFSELFIKRFLR